MFPLLPKRWKYRDSVSAVLKQNVTIKAASLEAYSDRALPHLGIEWNAAKIFRLEFPKPDI